MSPLCDDEQLNQYQFHWLPFTLAYWLVAVVVSVAVGSGWTLFGFWLASPAVLAAAWLLRVKVTPWLAERKR
jgi:hypothetical protein